MALQVADRGVHQPRRDAIALRPPRSGEPSDQVVQLFAPDALGEVLQRPLLLAGFAREFNGGRNVGFEQRFRAVAIGGPAGREHAAAVGHERQRVEIGTTSAPAGRQLGQRAQPPSRLVEAPPLVCLEPNDPTIDDAVELPERGNATPVLTTVRQRVDLVLEQLQGDAL